MYKIEARQASEDFAKCWRAAGTHLQKQVQGGISWLKADLVPPILEHLSFRLGNQAFYVRIEDLAGRLEVPASRQGLMHVANGCNGHACLMPMKKRVTDGQWVPDCAGWGLIDATTGSSIDPLALVSDEKIEITEWELHDFAVQVVRDQLRKEGYEIMSAQGHPNADPSIWFVGDSNRPEWVVVRAVRYPESDAERPRHWAGIAASCAELSKIGHFASVAFVSTDNSYDPGRGVTPLWRGHGVHVRYAGLEK